MAANRVADLTVEEFRTLIRETVEEVICDIMEENETDAGREFKPEVAAYLRKALRGENEYVSWDDALKELGLDD